MIPTQFALAERAATEKLENQFSKFSKFSFDIILDNLPGFILILNFQRQIIYVNRSFIHYLGIKERSEFYGLRPGELLKCAHAYVTEGGCGTTEFCRTCGAVKAILKSLEGIPDIQECRILQITGNSLNLKVWANPIDIDGEVYTVFSMTDISNEKKRRVLERSFFKEILNKVNKIKWIMEIFPKNSKEVIKEYYYLSDMIEQLTDEINFQEEIVSAENNDLQINLTKFDTREIFTQVMQYCKKHENCHDRVIRMNPKNMHTEIFTDKILLYRVLINMVINAIEASTKYQVVTIGVTNLEGNFVEFYVHNPGYIPQEIQTQIFQHSFSTKTKGKGIGTYSMKLIGEKYLNGKVEFTSSEKEGTVFKILIKNTILE